MNMRANLCARFFSLPGMGDIASLLSQWVCIFAPLGQLISRRQAWFGISFYFSFGVGIRGGGFRVQVGGEFDQCLIDFENLVDATFF
jgi:hypothetical protein